MSCKQTKATKGTGKPPLPLHFKYFMHGRTEDPIPDGPRHEEKMRLLEKEDGPNGHRACHAEDHHGGLHADKQSEQAKLSARSQEGEDELEAEYDEYTLPFLQIYSVVVLMGSLVLMMSYALYDPSPLSFNSVGLIGTTLGAGAILGLSFLLPASFKIAHVPVLCRAANLFTQSPSRARGRKRLHVGLYIYIVVVDVILTLSVLTDRDPRDIYLWFLGIPLLVLYACGVRACVASLVFVIVQTTVLRYLRTVTDFTGLAPPNLLRHTFIGETYCDCWLMVMVTTLAASHYHARMQAMARLRSAMMEKDVINRELRRATQAKSDFLANMSHELRTPMHGIIAMCHELKDHVTPSSKANRAITIISDCADHMQSLVSDILDLERIESNQLELEDIAFSIGEEAQKAVHLFEITAEKKNIDLSLEMAIVHPWRRGDPLRFRQILVNLLSNALKFTPPGGSVKLSLQDASAPITVTVSDTGIGIPEESLKSLFTPFSQLDSSICRKFGGSGLGLAITRRLCSAMGGSIECSSVVGKGSTFRCHLYLPLADQRERRASSADIGRQHMTNQPAGNQVNNNFPGLRVLLVEDNEVNQKVGKRVLQALGCDIQLASNGEECLKMMEQNSYDVILMDCQMPVMDGFQATEKIREIEAQTKSARAVPIIALTASATKEYAQRCIQVGMNHVLFKPLHREVLAAALRKWTSGNSPPSFSEPEKEESAQPTPQSTC